MTTHSAAEREALVDALTAAGPDAPTLCAGWTTRDLAAHLVVRERRPDAAGVQLVPGLSRWSERVRRGYARQPYAELVEMVRTGPPLTSPFALPRADALLNLSEHFVHCEDVRRAGPTWAPRALPAERQRALWTIVSRRGRLFYRKSPVGVVLALLGGPRRTVIDREPFVVLIGAGPELLLHAFGRGDHAQVDYDGPADAVTLLRELRPSV